MLRERVTRRVWALALAVALGTHPTVTAQAPASSSLAQGIQQVEEGDLDAAVITLDDVIRRLSAQPAQERNLTTAYLYLGMAQLGLNQIERARASVRSAAKVSPNLILDARRFPLKVIQMFEEAKRAALAAAPPTPAQAASPPPPFSAASAKNGGSKATPIILVGGAAAAISLAVATRGKPPLGDDSLDVDADGDGFTLGQGDCNDRDPQINPNGDSRFSVDFAYPPGEYPCSATNRQQAYKIQNNSCSSLSVQQLFYEVSVMEGTMFRTSLRLSISTVGGGSSAIIRSGAPAGTTQATCGSHPRPFSINETYTATTGAGTRTVTNAFTIVPSVCNPVRESGGVFFCQLSTVYY